VEPVRGGGRGVTVLSRRTIDRNQAGDITGWTEELTPEGQAGVINGIARAAVRAFGPVLWRLGWAQGAKDAAQPITEAVYARAYRDAERRIGAASFAAGIRRGSKLVQGWPLDVALEVEGADGRMVYLDAATGKELRLGALDEPADDEPERTTRTFRSDEIRGAGPGDAYRTPDRGRNY